MGFDKSATPTNKNTKQVAIMVLLGLVLAGVVGRMVLNRPANADAAPANDNLAAPTASANDLMKDLNADPTAELLRGGADVSSPLDTPPADPFAVSPQLRALITPRVATVPADPIDTHAPVTTATDLPEAKVDPTTIKLSGIFTTSHGPIALINGQIVRAGSVVNNVRVLTITPDRIVCEPAQGGTALEIPLAAAK